MTDFTAGASANPRGTVPTVLQGRPTGTLGDIVRHPQHYLLLLRFLVVNSAALALLAAAWLQGWVVPVFEADVTGLSLAIAGVFAVGLGICAVKVWRTSCEINLTKRFNPAYRSRAAVYVESVRGRDAGSRAILASALRLKLSQRVAVVRHIANSLVLLGLIGTVVGFIIALSGVDAEKAGDASTIAPMVTRLIEGMSVALYTTLVGSVLSIWLTVNYNLLATGTVNLVTDIVALGERHAGT